MELYPTNPSTRNRLRSAMLLRSGERQVIRQFKEAVIRMLIDDDDEEAEGMTIHLAQYLSDGALSHQPQ